MSPLVYLACCFAVSVAALLIDLVDELRLRARLRGLAARHGLHFSSGDRFNFASDVASRFPVVGAADPEVSDLLYGRRDNRYFYIFRFDYTTGATGRKQRRRAILGFSEPVERGPKRPAPLQAADPMGAILRQYENLVGQIGL